MGLHVVVLAAGAGKRMNSAHSKLLHQLAGEPLLQHVYNTARALNPDQIHVIYGHYGEQVRAAMAHLQVNWVEQIQQLGTGHAVAQALPYINNDDRVLVLYGDVPLISLATLTALLDASPADGIGIVAAEFTDPTGLGRILRDHSGNITGIVEHRDANEQQRDIDEIYTGILTAPASRLKEWLPKLSNNNSQKEYYLTDLVKLSVHDKRSVIGVLASCQQEVEGVNDRFQLADLERYYQQQAAYKVMLAGASLKDPARFDLRGTLEVSADVIIDVNVLIEGTVSLGQNTRVGANCVLKNVRVGNNVVIHPNCVIEDTIIEDNCTVGPFARLRPDTHLLEHAHIGNFVEIKKSTIGSHSKVNHLSYIGDSELGHHVNIGAGTITCNYDGVNKYQTIIGDYVFVGSNTQLIAPVKVGDNATIAAGTTVMQDAPAGELTLNPLKQTTKPGWQRPSRHCEER